MQIKQITKHADDLKKEFQDQQDRSTQEVERTSEEMLQNITVLNDLYIYGTGLADRRADKDVLKEFDVVSAHMMNTEKSLEFEERLTLETPYLHIGV